MALYIIQNKFKVYRGEKSAEPKFRRELSGSLIEKFGKGPFTQDEITEAIKFCLDYYIGKFKNICLNETTFYFYQSVLMFHEEATELAVLHKSKSDNPNVTEEYLASYRRILKFILETGCDVQMKVVKPTSSDRSRIERMLDDLLFLGEMILMCVSIYAEQGMIEDVGELTFDKNNLYVFSRRHHYNSIFDHILEKWGYNMEKVIVDDIGMNGFFTAIEQCLNVKYQDAGGVVGAVHQEIAYAEGVLWDNLPQNLELLFGVPYETGHLFYQGLTLTRDNKMSLLNLACKPYNLNRYLYRPIIVWNINDQDYAIIGPNAWSETMIQFVTNAIPWGKGPEEWMKNRCFKNYVHRKEDEHDKWLDDAVLEVLKTSNCNYDRNVKKLRGNNGYINIDVPGLGEIDFIVVAHDLKKYLITDCKHLVSRYDVANQKNDYNAFVKGSNKTKSYNETMQNKVKWFSSQKKLLQEHFTFKDGLTTDLTDYEVEGIFVLNTPTLYMFNSDFRIYLLNDIKAVMDGSYTDTEFIIHVENEDSVALIKVPYPYFRKPQMLTIDPFDNE
jgi:hypothetical protein